MWNWRLVLIFSGIRMYDCGFENCHDEPGYDPDEGIVGDMQFTWLGMLQYIHMGNGQPHYFKVPRVVLITRQHVLCTAVDAHKVPDGFALGNVIFDQYERDEDEFHLTQDNVDDNQDCKSAVLGVPIADVFVHPEYKQLEVAESLALLMLLSPIRSKYLLPICLPFKNNLVASDGKQNNKKLFHIDYVSEIPRRLLDEEREIIIITPIPQESCDLLTDSPKNKSNLDENVVFCSDACGFNTGSPSMVHEHTGYWTLVALSQGGSPCFDPLRPSEQPPPRHILVHPYVPWIKETITGFIRGDLDREDPFGFVSPSSAADKVLPEYRRLGWGWHGHWWLGGVQCYNRGATAENMVQFYHERFQVDPDRKANVAYVIELAVGTELSIVCVKVGLPNQILRPTVWGLETSHVKLRVPVPGINTQYKFQVDAWAVNGTLIEEKESSEEETSTTSISNSLETEQE